MNKAIQCAGLFKREVVRYCKVPLQTIVVPIVNSILYLLIFGVSLGNSISLQEDLPYLAFLIPGLVAMALIKNSFDNASSVLVMQKYFNELQDLRVTPLTIGQIYLCKTGASLTRGILVAFLTFFVGEVFYVILHGDLLRIAFPGMLFFFIVCGGLAFGSLGIAIGMVAKTFEHIGAISMLILLPLIYLGGVFFDLDYVHPLWKTLSYFNPLFYIISGVRYSILGITDVNIGGALGVTFLFFLLCSILALISLKKGSRYVR